MYRFDPSFPIICFFFQLLRPTDAELAAMPDGDSLKEKWLVLVSRLEQLKRIADKMAWYPSEDLADG